MSKIIILGDCHIGSRNDSLVFAEYHISFFMEQLFPYMKSNNISVIWQLGDMFDRRKFINFNILKYWKDTVFKYMQDNNIEFNILIGNHDTTFKNTNDTNSPELILREYENVKLYSKTTEVLIDKTAVAIFPWINSENENDTNTFLKTTKANIAFGHFEFSGFEMDKGNKHEDGLSTKKFKKFEAVYSGHFHHRSTDGHVHYVGIPYQMTWVDYGSIKGFHIFDSDTLDCTFVENPKQIFVRFVYDDSSTSEDYHRCFDMTNLKGKYIKIIVSNKKNLYEFDQFMSKLYAQSPADIKIVETVQEQDGTSENLDLESTKDILDKYFENIDNDSIDKNKLKKMLHELYTEALNMETV